MYVQVIVFTCKIYGGLRARVHSSIQTTVSAKLRRAVAASQASFTRIAKVSFRLFVCQCPTGAVLAKLSGIPLPDCRKVLLGGAAESHPPSRAPRATSTTRTSYL